MTDSNATNLVAIDDFLAHYGVKGMRWGVRKDRSAGGSGSSGSGSKKKIVRSTGAAKPATKAVAKAKTDAAKPSIKKPSHAKDAKEMSDDDLKKILSRMQMEKQYAQLMSEREQAGQGGLTKFAATNGKTLATKINERLLNEGANAIAGLIIKGVTKAAVKSVTK